MWPNRLRWLLLIGVLLVVTGVAWAVNAIDETVESDLNADIEFANSVREMESRLEAAEPQKYGGFYVANELEYRLVVMWTDPNPFQPEAYTSNPRLLEVIEIEHAQHTINQLKSSRMAVAELAERLGIQQHTTIDTKRNRALLLVKNVERAQAALDAVGETLPAGAVLLHESELDADI